MSMVSDLYYINMLYWIFIVLAHWNNSPLVDMSIYCVIFTQIPKVFIICHSYCVAYICRGEATHTSFIVSGLIRPVLHTHFSPILIFLPGKMSIYSVFSPEKWVYTEISPPEKWVYTEFSPRKSKYVLTHTHFSPHTSFSPLLF